MTLLDMQRAFSRILTDKEFRAAFAAGDEAARTGFDLTDREYHSLRRLRWDRVNLHADLLASGRVALALKALPLTNTLLHGPLHGLVDRFCAEYPPRPESAGSLFVESGRLCEFTLRLIDGGEVGPPWAADVVRYERTLMTLGASGAAWESAFRVAELNRRLGPTPADAADLVPVLGPHAELAEFRYPLPDLVVRLEQGAIPTGVQPLDRPLRILLYKLPHTLYVQAARVNEPTAALIADCDGRRTVGQVVDRLAARYGPGARAAAGAALERLRGLGVLAFRRGG